ncbi:SDR family oxidoreductase [Sphingopyxis sp. OPL5]|uniref:SDR family NAD(P)-dependent oxidoreductase n=1 Tax=Sphingopyxis sp. OPL5 TaxID=2486273 RepID=UPI00164E42FD|nr:SDR family oxidoreductase [Sphingopyxis sp. OPL5]QNO26504.1 SDR family oxidoreductase [Sphingopyxis sp. OPL5]
MDLELAGEPIVIVGGTQGMGYATARQLAEEGAKLALIARDMERGEAKAAALRALGAEVIVRGADATRPGEVEDAIASAADHFGRLYGLAVTAGPVLSHGSFEEDGDAAWEASFQAVLMTSVRACQAALPIIAASGGGAVVLTASYSTRAAAAHLYPYVAMKSGIAALSKNLAIAYGPKGVRVNCVAPGAVATEALASATEQAVAAYGDDPEAALDRWMTEQWGMKVALGRVGRPHELADLFAFLLSKRAAYMTGAIINQDGGTQFF